MLDAVSELLEGLDLEDEPAARRFIQWVSATGDLEHLSGFRDLVDLMGRRPRR